MSSHPDDAKTIYKEGRFQIVRESLPKNDTETEFKYFIDDETGKSWGSTSDPIKAVKFVAYLIEKGA